MTAGSLPKLHPATLSYRPPLRLTQIGAFWCLADRCQRDFPALSDMHWTAMAGSKQSHGSLINDLCPLMVHPVLPQHLLSLSSYCLQRLQLKSWSCSISQDLRIILRLITAPFWLPYGAHYYSFNILFQPFPQSVCYGTTSSLNSSTVQMSKSF